MIIDQIGDKQHIIWDWNGTILDDVSHAVDTMNAMLSEHSLNAITVDRYKEIFQFPVKNYYDALGFDYSKKSFEALCHEYVAGYMNAVEQCRPYPYIDECLASIHGLGKVQSVLSATDQPNLDKMVGHFGYSEIFTYVYGIENQYGESKVERGRELIALSEVALNDTVLIGDTIHDIEVGDALGIDVILVSHGHQCHNILKRHHHNVLDVYDVSA